MDATIATSTAVAAVTSIRLITTIFTVSKVKEVPTSNNTKAIPFLILYCVSTS
jgi:hypothetical protein